MNIIDYNLKKSDLKYKNITKFVGSFLLNYHNSILKLKKMSKGIKLSLKVLDKNMIDVEQEFEVVEKFQDISRLIIPFSVAFKKFNPPDIYNGEELIPFDEKDLEFKEILIQEFLTGSNKTKKDNKRK